MSSITAILQKGQGIGFELTGIQVREVSSLSEAHEVLAEEMENKDNGLILVDEKYAKDYSARFQKKVDESIIPIIVNIPITTKWEYVYDPDEVFQKIIKRAVGYSIKLTGV